MHELSAIIERLHDDVILPSRATAGSAGYDVRAYLRARRVRCSDGMTQVEREADERDGSWGIDLAPREMALVPLGFRTRLPPDVEAQVRPRSGQAFKHALTIPNAPGTVDAGYRGEIAVTLLNTDRREAIELKRGDRIAQMVIQRVEYARFLPVQELSDSVRGGGGFGSTGGFGAPV